MAPKREMKKLPPVALRHLHRENLHLSGDIHRIADRILF